MPTVSESVKEYGRGIAGGFLFSLPLLYTMEVWRAGFIIQPHALLIYIAFTFLLLLGYNRFAGMRKDNSFKEVIIDSVEEMGIGLLFAFFLLLILDRVEPGEMATDEIIGKVIVKGMIVAIGVSVGTAQLGKKKGEGKTGMGKEDKKEKNMFLNFIVLSLCGGFLIASTVGPTEEIIIIAYEISPLQVLGLFVFSLVIATSVLFYINFVGTVSTEKIKPFQVFAEISTTYFMALAASAFILFFYGRLENNGIEANIYAVVVLAVAGTLGASAGRLLIKGT